jgi:hypothetical protein
MWTDRVFALAAQLQSQFNAWLEAVLGANELALAPQRVTRQCHQCGRAGMADAARCGYCSTLRETS